MDAIVGGYENEPLYIARAIHFNSLTPGKYLRTTNKMFVPWGHTAYRKYDFEVRTIYCLIFKGLIRIVV